VPYGPGHAPGKAALYLTVFLPPGERPEFVRGDLREVLSEEDLEADIELYNFARGYIADQEKVAPLVSNINEAHEEIRGGSPPQPNPAIVSMWRDLNVLNEVGIPAVTFGPSRTTEEYSGTKHRCMHVDDLVKAAKLYAYITLATCGITE
jgi:acetylornithine deacetylase/succinyl-diaminopimelate desuccinylase-like protein